MKHILYFTFLSSIIFTGCNKSSEVEIGEDKATSEHGATEMDSPVEVNSNQQSQPDAANNNQSIDPITIAPEEEINEKIAQEDVRNAKPAKNFFKHARRLNLEEIEKINHSLRDNPILPADPDIHIRTPTEVFERINISLSMASAPEVFAEDETYYYFSGGLSVGRVDDFSSGIRMSKIGGAIHVWRVKNKTKSRTRQR